MRDGPVLADTARFAAALALVVVLAAATLAWLHSATPDLYGYDGYFHIRYAEVLRSEGVSRTFRWWDETFLRDRFADKDFLYHVLLIPFTFGDLMAGGKLAAVVFGAAAIGVFHLAAQSLRVPWPGAWSCGLLACSTAFLYRLGFTRPSIAAVALALAGTALILAGRHRWAFAVAAAYPHLHISYHLLPCIALLYDLHRRVEDDGRGSFRLTRWTSAGALAGAVLTPYFPNNLYLWWVQNIRVLGLAWKAPEDLGMGLEIRPGLSSQLLGYNIGVFLALALAVYILARPGRRASPQALTLLVISLGFLALSMMSRRFVEFLAPFALLLAGVAVRDSLAGARPVARRAGIGLAAAAIAVVAALFALNVSNARRIIATDPGAVYGDAIGWMAVHVEPGEKIFHLDWDDFPELFFHGPQFRYLLGLDPAFMYVTDPDRWRSWQEASRGAGDDLYGTIRGDFASRWVFAGPASAGFRRAAERDPRFFLRYTDENSAIYFLADGYRFVDRWEVVGWFPNPSMRLFDATLTGEPPRPGAPKGPEPIGPASAGSRAEPRSGYVDLARAISVPPGVMDACGVARARVQGGPGGKATIAVTTDDEYRLYLGGAEIAARSPRAEPPPGSPGGPPVSLDTIEEDPALRREAWHEVSLPAGESELILKSCRVGDDFGFYLRIFLEDGTHLGAMEG